MSPKVKKIGLSVLVLSLLSVQFLASMGLITWRMWPFMAYGMYCTPHYEGDAVPLFGLKGTLDDATPVTIEAHDLNFNFWEYLNGPVAAARQDDKEALFRYLKKYETATNQSLATVQLIERPTVIRKNSYEEAPPRVLKTFEKGSTP